MRTIALVSIMSVFRDLPAGAGKCCLCGVAQAEELDELNSERKESVVKVMHLKSDNSVLKRRINHLEPEEGVKFPRPGPSLKPFEDLTPREQKVASYDLQSRVLKTSEERGILPSKLSAYLTYR